VIYFAFPTAHSSDVVFFVLFILYAIPFTLTEGAERAWISTMVPAEARGRSFGLYYLATGIFVLLGDAALRRDLRARLAHRGVRDRREHRVIAALFVIFTPAARYLVDLRAERRPVSARRRGSRLR